MIVFAMDERSVQSYTSQLGLKVGVGTTVTLGTMNLNVAANVNLSESGASGTFNAQSVRVGGTVSVAFCQGAYVSASVSGGVVAPNVIVNRKFYEDRTLSARDILFRQDLDVPHNKFSSDLQAIYGKLELFSRECNGAEFETEGNMLQLSFPTAMTNILETKVAIIEDEETDTTAAATPHSDVVISITNGTVVESDDRVGETPTQMRR